LLLLLVVVVVVVVVVTRVRDLNGLGWAGLLVGLVEEGAKTFIFRSVSFSLSRSTAIRAKLDLHIRQDTEKKCRRRKEGKQEGRPSIDQKSKVDETGSFGLVQERKRSAKRKKKRRKTAGHWHRTKHEKSNQT
jgi:hypothetical protein